MLDIIDGYFSFEEAAEDAETQEISFWETDSRYRLVSAIRDSLDIKCRYFPEFKVAINLSYKGKWVAVENGCNEDLRTKVYDSLVKLQEAYKGRETKAFVYQIGTDNIGPLNQIVWWMGPEEFAPVAQPAEPKPAEMQKENRPIDEETLEKIVA